MLFSFSDCEHIANRLEQVDSLEESRFTIARHENAELHAAILAPVAGKRCFILGTIAPPDERIISFTLLAHTLKCQGATHVTGILPYLAYTRQDKVKAGESLAAAWAGSLLQASGVDEILTIDVHSERDVQLFPIPLVSLSPAHLFAAEIAKQNLKDATIVAPDHGALPRCQAVLKAAGLSPAAIPYFEKKRTENGIIHGGLMGQVSSRAILVDDILDTGGTLVSACEKLKALRTEEIYVFVTHGAFTGEKWKQLWSLSVRQIYCTDIIPSPRPHEAEGRITTLSVVPMLREYFSELVANRRALTFPVKK